MSTEIRHFEKVGKKFCEKILTKNTILSKGNISYLHLKVTREIKRLKMEESPPQNTNSEITNNTQSKKDCPFCHSQNIGQTLLEHTLNCAEYEKVLDETTCPLCHIEVDGSMTFHIVEHIKKKDATCTISNSGN